MHPPLVPLERLPSLICASVAWQSLFLTSYLSFGFLSPMIVLIDVNLSHFFCLPPPSLFLSFQSKVSTLVLTLIHCMSAQNIEKEWIKLTCTWLVVWGRVKIRFQRRPSVKL